MKKVVVEYEGQLFHGEEGLTIPRASRILTVDKENNRFQALIDASEEFIKCTVSTDMDQTFATKYQNLKEAIKNAKD